MSVYPCIIVICLLDVDLEFEKLLHRIFGLDFIDALVMKTPSVWVELMTSFEACKRTASLSKTTSINFSLPSSFNDLYQKVKVSAEFDFVIRQNFCFTFLFFY